MSGLAMDQIDDANINGLKQNGLSMWERDQDKIEALLRKMVDDTFG